MVHHSRLRLARSVLALAAASLATAAVAAPAPKTHLVTCGSESCLLIAGHRADTALPVSINGHTIAVTGGRSWHVRVPLTQLRAWSLPAARSVVVVVAQADGRPDTLAEASLPVGVLGHVTKLATLVVTIR